MDMPLTISYSNLLSRVSASQDMDPRKARFEAGLEKVARALEVDSDALKQAFEEVRNSASPRLSPGEATSAVAEQLGIEASRLKSALDRVMGRPPAGGTSSGGLPPRGAGPSPAPGLDPLGFSKGDLEKALRQSLEELREPRSGDPGPASTASSSADLEAGNFLDRVSRKLGVKTADLAGALEAAGPQLVDRRV